MRIGFISSQFPYDLRTSVYGGFKRMGMFIHALKQLGELEMLFYVRPELNLRVGQVAEMEMQLSKHYDAKIKLSFCRLAPVRAPSGRWQEYISPALSITNLSPYMQTAQIEQVDAARKLLARKPDIIFVHRLAAMVPVLLCKAQCPKIYFDLDDIEHISFLRSIKQPPLWLGKRLLYLRLPIIKYWEKRAIRVSRATFVCSDQDREYLDRKVESQKVVVIPNAVDLPASTPIPVKQNLLFLGLLSFYPNTIAADHLIKEIWPRILSSLPEANLLVAGAKPESLMSYKERPKGVKFVGFVDDLGKLYEDVTVVCCPILFGSGTRIKILEAAAHGRPVVSTTIGAEGIDLKDGEEILLRDDPAAFAEACIRLLKDRAESTRMGQKARSVIEQKYEQRVVVKNIKTFIDNTIYA